MQRLDIRLAVAQSKDFFPCHASRRIDIRAVVGVRRRIEKMRDTISAQAGDVFGAEPSHIVGYDVREFGVTLHVGDVLRTLGKKISIHAKSAGKIDDTLTANQVSLESGRPFGRGLLYRQFAGVINAWGPMPQGQFSPATLQAVELLGESR